ncbi:MAG: glycoside hydrolase family 127 protein [Treponema sp.]|nr:glycoside hydrolase family 127 protein [Treponema sp.]
MDFFFNGAGKTELLDSLAKTKMQRNLKYVLSLKNDNLLLPFYYEAGFINWTVKKTDVHWGWDSIFSHIRGTFTGHWLSAAARLSVQTGNKELLEKANFLVSEIARCQKENGGRWAFPIPEKYLHWLKKGKRIWAPQYVCHKVMMGLFDMHSICGNETALTVLNGCGDWFHDFTDDISRETMDEMMDFEETGGILEIWADLYGLTGEQKYLDLIHRYERPHLYEPLLAGRDVLTNMHANSSIPEILGAARAYEVTGEQRYRDIAEAYWKSAVDNRGMFVTGGQTDGEIWTPPFKQSARLSDMNQEHCVVYHMMRLSQYLYRWTGESKYADYWERNLYNGIFAQGYWEEDKHSTCNEDNPRPHGHLVYYLPLAAGGKKVWGSETDHFWCCHCTLVQANANVYESVFFRRGNNIIVSQYINAELKTDIDGAEAVIRQEENLLAGETFRILPAAGEYHNRPSCWAFTYKIKGNGKNFALSFRSPFWLSGKALIKINGEEIQYKEEKGFLKVERVWNEDTLELMLPKKLTAWPLPDRPDQAAFLDGPVALAGLCSEERTLYGDIDNPETFFTPDAERKWVRWQPNWRTVNQPVNIKFVPIYTIGYEPYTVYFPVKKA